MSDICNACEKPLDDKHKGQVELCGNVLSLERRLALAVDGLTRIADMGSKLRKENNPEQNIAIDAIAAMRQVEVKP